MSGNAKKLVLLLAAGAVFFAILLSTQSYFSYKETTAVADACYEKGGFPAIKKSGLKIVYFECHMDAAN